MLRKLGSILREGGMGSHCNPGCHEAFRADAVEERLIDLLPGHQFDDQPLCGAAIDIGTTTVTVWLVDLSAARSKPRYLITTVKSRAAKM